MALVAVALFLLSSLVVGGNGATLVPRTPAAPSSASSELAWARETLSAGHGPVVNALRIHVPGTWSRTCSGPCGPGHQSAMVYDPADQYVVWFSECAAVNCSTWTFSGGKWTELNLTIGPSPREGVGMTWDAKDGYVLLFGGNAGPSSFATLNDTWAFRGGNWTNLSAGKAPSVRVDPLIAYDAALGDVVLLGGTNGTHALNDTWFFHAGTWVLLGKARGPPSGIIPVGMVYDPAVRALVWLGEGLYYPYQAMQTWTFVSGRPWLLASFDQGAFYSLGGTLGTIALTYDSLDGYVLAYGQNGSGSLPPSATWKYTAGNWTQLHPVTAPPGSVVGIACFDGALNRTFLFGTDRDGAAADWLFNGTTWANAIPSPSVRTQSNMVYDSTDGYVVLFGGMTTGTVPTNDTWKFENGRWSELFPARSPPAREAFMMADDPADGYVLVFGGNATIGALHDTWTFVGGAWTHVLTSPAPSARYYASMSYDVADGRVVLFGGTNSTAYFNDTWRFSHGAWSRLALASHPPARALAQMAYDPLIPGVLLVGGYSNAIDPGTHSHIRGDTWVFVHGGWTPRTLSRPGVGAYKASMAFDAKYQFELLIGGATDRRVALEAVYENGNWSRVDVSGSQGPLGFVHGSMVWDPAEGYMLFFGGGSVYHPDDETMTFS